jgi:hypothetical protein
VRAWYHYFPCIVFVQARLARLAGVRQILIAKRVNFRDDASDRWSSRLVSPSGSDFRLPARIPGFPARSATCISVPGKRSP